MKGKPGAEDDMVCCGCQQRAVRRIDFRDDLMRYAGTTSTRAPAQARVSESRASTARGKGSSALPKLAGPQRNSSALKSAVA
jgi:hypothetical protein